MQAHHRQLLATLAVLLALLALLPAPTVFADAPGTRGGEGQPQGGTSHPADTRGVEGVQGGVRAGKLWQGVQMLPPPMAMQPSGAPVRAATQGDGGNASFSWLSRELNPGNWILDAGMGIVTAIFSTFSELLQGSAMSLMPGSAAEVSTSVQAEGFHNWSILPASCGDAAGYNLVFCTPASLTYDHPNMARIWSVTRAVAIAIVTFLFFIRLFRLMLEGPKSLETEGKSLLLSFVGSALFISQSHWVMSMVIELFNLISEALLACANGNASACPTPPLPTRFEDGTLNPGSAVMYILFWITVLILVLKGLLRVAHITVLVAVAPLAGAMLMDRSTSSRFRSWLDKLIDLLAEQIALVIVFICAAALLQPLQSNSSMLMQGWENFVNVLFGTITLLMTVFGGPAVIGIAKAAPASYLQSRMQMAGVKMAGRAGAQVERSLRGRALAGMALAAEGLGAVGAADRLSQAATAARGDRSSRVSGDPRHAAATGREGRAGVGGAGGPASELQGRRRPGHFGRVARDLRLRSGATRDSIEAGRMRRRADSLDRYGRTGLVARPSGRYGRRLADGTYEPNEAGLARREAIKRAQVVAGGMAGVERDDLHRRLSSDERRLARLRNDMAVAESDGASSGRMAELHERYATIDGRLRANRERFAATDPGTVAGRANLRRVALALADRELPPTSQRNRAEDTLALQAAQRGVARARRGQPSVRRTARSSRYAERAARIAGADDGVSPGEQAARQQRARQLQERAEQLRQQGQRQSASPSRNATGRVGQGRVTKRPLQLPRRQSAQGLATGLRHGGSDGLATVATGEQQEGRAGDSGGVTLGESYRRRVRQSVRRVRSDDESGGEGGAA